MLKMNQYSATAEDVFYLYERNKSYYDNCKLAKRTCPSEIYNADCYCQRMNEFVLPITIGDQCVPCNFKRKTYIKQGDECSICLEQIIAKSTSHLTPCGHPFHKICIFKAFDTIAEKKRTFRCPICRANLGYPEIYCRYTAVFKERELNLTIMNNNNHFLDTLEEFWLSKDYMLIHKCRNQKHYLGMDNNCKYCLQYRINGM